MHDNEPDAVHRMRVVVRRLRSRLEPGPARTDLAWLAAALGEPRDVEVLQAGFATLASSQPDLDPEAVAFIQRTLAHRHADALRRLRRRMQTKRYVRLLDDVRGARVLSGTTEKADQVERAWRRLKRRVAAVTVAVDDVAREELLHEVRKAAKRLRYAAEPIGKTSPTVVAARALQELLGEHHDAVVLAQVLQDLAPLAAHEGVNAFSFGVLAERERTRASETATAFPQAWDELRRTYGR